MTLKVIFKVIPRLQAFSIAIRRTFVQHFVRFQLTAVHDQLSPKWAWLTSRDCLKFTFKPKCLNSGARMEGFPISSAKGLGLFVCLLFADDGDFMIHKLA